MPLRVWIADRQSVRGAMVSGYVRRPDGVKASVTLLDDGLSMDGAANDGIYGLAYGATIPGAYYANLKASGSSNAGVPFERYVTTAFVLPGERHRPVPPSEGLPTPQGKGCSLGIFLLLLLLLLSILLIVVAWQKRNRWCLLIAILLIVIAALFIWFCCRR
jgi:hypothetical protein